MMNRITFWKASMEMRIKRQLLHIAMACFLGMLIVLPACCNGGPSRCQS